MKKIDTKDLAERCRLAALRCAEESRKAALTAEEVKKAFDKDKQHKI